MGEDKRGVFKEIRLVIGVSRVISEAGKPRNESVMRPAQILVATYRTNVARQDQEIIVSQGTVLVRVKQGIDIQTISGWIVVLQNLQGFGVVLDFCFGSHGEIRVGIYRSLKKDDNKPSRMRKQSTEATVRGSC
jgi:hypothetical protein